MIAAVKGWHAVLSALLCFIPQAAPAADSLGGAARELARKTAAFVGKSEPVSVVWRNVSSLGSSEFGQARSELETVLRGSGVALSESAGIMARITLSENGAQFLLVEEISRRDERQVWIAGWQRGQTATPTGSAPILEKKLLWEQEEQILDVAFPPAGMLVLSLSKVAWFEDREGKWQLRGTVALPAGNSRPRDARGRLRFTGPTFKVHLPDTLCGGSIEPALTLDCRLPDEPWVLESGSRDLLLAAIASGRNYFDGRITTQAGVRKTVPPFYSAAAIEEQGRTFWLLAGTDGRTQIFDTAFEPVAAISSWGSDIAGVDPRCGSPSIVLATRAADTSTADGVHASAIVDRGVVPLAAAVDFPGPVVALWPSGGAAAVVVARNLASGRYEAYLVALSCGS
jgi:hypothetical protein